MITIQSIEKEELNYEDNQPKYTVNMNTSQQIEAQFDFNETSNYLSCYEQQPATIDLDFNDYDTIVKPSLLASIKEPATHQDIFNKKSVLANNSSSF